MVPFTYGEATGTHRAGSFHTTMQSSSLIVYSFALTSVFTLCCTLPAFNVRTLPKSPCEVSSHIIDLHNTPSFSSCKNYPTLLINVPRAASLDATLSKLRTRRAVLVVPHAHLVMHASILRSAARAGHIIVLQHDSVFHVETGIALYESLLGFPSIFSIGAQNASNAFTLVGLENPIDVLVDSAAVRWSQGTHICDSDVGLISRLDNAQIACIHKRIYCDFVTPGEVLWRFCKDLRAKFERHGGGKLGNYASRRDRSGDVEDMIGFVERNRGRVALARELAGRGVEDAMFVLYGMSEGEVEDYIQGKRRAVGGQGGTNIVRWLAGVLCLVLGIAGIVYNLLSMTRRRGWRLIAKAADFGKIV